MLRAALEFSAATGPSSNSDQVSRVQCHSAGHESIEAQVVRSRVKGEARRTLEYTFIVFAVKRCIPIQKNAAFDSPEATKLLSTMQHAAMPLPVPKKQGPTSTKYESRHLIQFSISSSSANACH